MAFVRGKTVEEAHRAREGQGHRNHGPLQARPGDLHRARVPLHHPGRPAAPAGVPEQGRHDHASRTSGEEPAKEETFFAKGGLIQFVEWLNRNKKPLHPKPIAFSATKDDVEVDLALQYEDGYNENTFTFVNNINTHEGGTHLTGFKSALTRTINDVAKRRDFLKKEDFTLSGEDIREGLTCVLHVKVREPQFEGQTKTKLGNSEVEGIVKAVVNEHLGSFLDEHPPVAREHHREGGQRGPGPRGGAQGARPGPQEVGPGERGAAGQAGRLLARRSGAVRDLPGRGRLGRRQRQAGPRPRVPGDPAAAGQDPQRRAGPDRQDPRQRGDPGDDHRHRHRA